MAGYALGIAVGAVIWLAVLTSAAGHRFERLEEQCGALENTLKEELHNDRP